MLSVLSITAPVFLIVALGYVCAARAFLNEGAQKTLSLFALYCALPCYLFLAMAKVPRDMIVNVDYIGAFAVSMGMVAVLGGLIARRFYKRDNVSTILAMMGACYTNSSFVGIPIIVMALGQPGPIVVITLFQVLVVTTTILTSIEIHQKHGAFSLRALREFPRTVLLNPLVGGSLLGVLFAVFSVPVPIVLERTLRLLGDASIPCGLFALGLSLGAMNLRTPSSGGKGLVCSLVVLKTLVHPALAWVIGHYVFHLHDPWLNAVILVAAMPTAVNNYIFAQRYNIFVQESSRVVFWSALVSLFTLSALLGVLGVVT